MILDFIAGLLGGMVGVVIGHPLDTIKVHLQVTDPDNPHYQTIGTTVTRLLEKEGVRTLFRGMTSPLIGLGLMNAIMFGIYNSVLRMMPDPESITAESVAGAASALGTSIVTSPMELAKSRVQIIGTAAGRNPFHALHILYKQEGMMNGVFKGLGVTVAREIPSNVTYFIVFEYLAHAGPPGEKPSLTRLFHAGGFAGVASWVVPYPADVIKSKIQVDGAKGPKHYKNWHDCLMKTIKTEGYKGLYAGLLPTVIRAYPVNGVTFVVVTLILRYFDTDTTSEKHPHKKPIKEASYVKDVERINCWKI